MKSIKKKFFHHFQLIGNCLRTGELYLKKKVRADMDPGFEEGRQYGRGKSGGQVREDHRTDYDEQRGGWGSGFKRNQFAKGGFNRKYQRGGGGGGGGGTEYRKLLLFVL